MTCWWKLLKENLLIPLPLSNVQLYRINSIVTAGVDTEKKRRKCRKVTEKYDQSGCWVLRNDWAVAVGLSHSGMQAHQAGMQPASNQLITAFKLIQ